MNTFFYSKKKEKTPKSVHAQNADATAQNSSNTDEAGRIDPVAVRFLRLLHCDYE